MKSISKLKLTQLSKADLAQRQMNYLKGGSFCQCSCAYANDGGSSSEDNRSANYGSGSTGYCSTSGCNKYYESEYGSGEWSDNLAPDASNGGHQ
jgi:natural product precursor